MITKLDSFFTSITRPIHIVVAQAEDPVVFEVMRDLAAHTGQVSFSLIGKVESLKKLADEYRVAVAPERLIDLKDDAEIAARAVGMVRSGEADLPMKGLMQTSTFMRAILNKETGIRGPGLLSEVTVFEKEWGEPGLQILTCCAINVNPGLPEKIQIIRNAAAMARTFGIEQPRVAALGVLEQVNPEMPETIDAAVLAKMSERGQIPGVIVDGPFALDNAISPEQAEHKGVGGPVAGRADILLASDIRMGNVLHKALTYLARKPVASMVLGAKVPVLANSRSDFAYDKVLSTALAAHLMSTQQP